MGFQQQLDFYVHIVESPSAVDLSIGRQEGAIISQALTLNRIPFSYKLFATKEIWLERFVESFNDSLKDFPSHLPIIHLSAHGGAAGIQLTDGQLIEWLALKPMLQAINSAYDGGILLALSCCKGYSAKTMAVQLLPEAHPFFAMVYNEDSPTWADTGVGYASFYHQLRIGRSVVEAVEAMKVASGNPLFTATTSVEINRSFQQYCSANTAQQVQQRLSPNVGGAPPTK